MGIGVNYKIYRLQKTDKNDVYRTKIIKPESGEVPVPPVDIPTRTSELINDSGFIQDDGTIVRDEEYVHTDNNYTTAEKTKLTGIESGAEVNVQSNWSQSTTTADDYIKNKPALKTVATTGSYTDLTNKPTAQDIANMVYPVGSIYMSVNNVSPGTLFGGTWERIQDTFLLSAGSSYTAGNTGGEATHTLIEKELPHMTGTFTLSSNLGTNVTGADTKWEGASGKFSRVSRTGRNILKYNSGTYSVSQNQTLYDRVSWQIGGEETSSGSGVYNTVSHNNMPPYLVVYMWKRTA